MSVTINGTTGVITPFENRPYGMELALCQRYYQNITGWLLGYSGMTKFPVMMRITPTFTASATSLSNCTMGTMSVWSDGASQLVS